MNFPKIVIEIGPRANEREIIIDATATRTIDGKVHKTHWRSVLDIQNYDDPDDVRDPIASNVRHTVQGLLSENSD